MTFADSKGERQTAENGFNVTVNTKRTVNAVLHVGLVGSALYAGVCLFHFYTNPILLINEDPRARLFVDGNPVEFEHGATGIAALGAWKPSFKILVQTPHTSEERRIYPWAAEKRLRIRVGDEDGDRI